MGAEPTLAQSSGALLQPGDTQRSAPAPSATYDGRLWNLSGLAALAFYLVLSLLFFARPLLQHFSAFQIGTGQDPGLMMWFLAWWPHAITNGLNPFLTRAIWPPSGVNLAWQTGIPLASIIAAPITLRLGPVVSYNLLCLLSLPLNAWCTFILCRYLTRNPFAAFLGGYIYGFSAYMLGQLTAGHLHMLLVFPVPLILYLTIRYGTGGAMRAVRFVPLIALLLVTQFLLSLEIFATMSMFGSIALLIAWRFGASDVKRWVFELLIPLVYSYAMALVLISPYLYCFLAHGFRSSPIFTALPSDPLNFIVPTWTTELGRIGAVRSFTHWLLRTGFPVPEFDSYLGLPLILLAILYARDHRSEPAGRLLIGSLLAIAILSLGPYLYVGGRWFPVALPWLPLSRLPVIDNALPSRFWMYGFLVMGIMTSLWLSDHHIRPSLKLGLAAAVVVFTIPNLQANFWARPVHVPEFFNNGLYRHYLSKGQTALILPSAEPSAAYEDSSDSPSWRAIGDTMLWQAQAHMYFNLAMGAAPFPEDFIRWPIFAAFVRQTYLPDATEQLTAFLSSHGVDTVIVPDRGLPTWQAPLSSLGVTPVKVGGVSLYRRLSSSQHETPSLREMRIRFDRQRFIDLITGTNTYLANGGDLKLLSAFAAGRLHVIPQAALLGPPALFAPSGPPGLNVIMDPRHAYGIWLGERSGGRVGVGLYAWYPAVAPLIEKLHNVISEIYFPYPQRLALTGAAPQGQAELLLVFSHGQLAEASRLLGSSPPEAVVPTTGAPGIPLPGRLAPRSDALALRPHRRLLPSTTFAFAD